MYKPGDYIVNLQDGITSRVERKGVGMYHEYWLTDFGYVWGKRSRAATAEEITGYPKQNLVVQILN